MRVEESRPLGHKIDSQKVSEDQVQINTKGLWSGSEENRDSICRDDVGAERE